MGGEEGRDGIEERIEKGKGWMSRGEEVTGSWERKGSWKKRLKGDGVRVVPLFQPFWRLYVGSKSFRDEHKSQLRGKYTELISRWFLKPVVLRL
jgi:hypothetical protein